MKTLKKFSPKRKEKRSTRRKRSKTIKKKTRRTKKKLLFKKGGGGDSDTEYYIDLTSKTSKTAITFKDIVEEIHKKLLSEKFNPFGKTLNEGKKKVYLKFLDIEGNQLQNEICKNLQISMILVEKDKDFNYTENVNKLNQEPKTGLARRSPHNKKINLTFGSKTIPTYQIFKKNRYWILNFDNNSNSKPQTQPEPVQPVQPVQQPEPKPDPEPDPAPRNRTTRKFWKRKPVQQFARNLGKKLVKLGIKFDKKNVAVLNIHKGIETQIEAIYPQYKQKKNFIILIEEPDFNKVDDFEIKIREELVSKSLDLSEVNIMILDIKQKYDTLENIIREFCVLQENIIFIELDKYNLEFCS